jgi:hypothetical protein
VDERAREEGWKISIAGSVGGGGGWTYQRRPPERGEVARKGPNIIKRVWLG